MLAMAKATIIALMAWLACAPAQAQSLRVVDGDTIVLDGERVRIFGLDCPELRNRGGVEARTALERLLRGATVHLKRRGRDRYGRTVAKVFLDGRDVTCTMIRTGLCREFTRYSRGEYEECR